MKLVTFEYDDCCRIGVLLEDGRIVDLSAAGDLRRKEGEGMDVGTSSDMLDFLRRGDTGFEAARETLAFVESRIANAPESLEGVVFEPDRVRIKAPVHRPGKIICLGLNYPDHAEEAGARPRKRPMLFAKAPSAVIGPDEPVLYPSITEQLDYEVELAVVVGKQGKGIAEEKAFEHIAGYTVFNDVTARDLQFADRQWFRGKGLDTFAPMGPCIVDKEEIPDPHALFMQMKVNGEVRQDGSTGNMIFKIPYLMAYISAGITLEPGDIIATGTPAGVGIFAKPEPRLLRIGDVMEACIEKIGILRNPVKEN